MDNVFIERLWRSLKHKDIYLKGYADGREAKRGTAAWIAFYIAPSSSPRQPHPMADGATESPTRSPPRPWTAWPPQKRCPPPHSRNNTSRRQNSSQHDTR